MLEGNNLSAATAHGRPAPQPPAQELISKRVNGGSNYDSLKVIDTRVMRARGVVESNNLSAADCPRASSPTAPAQELISKRGLKSLIDTRVMRASGVLEGNNLSAATAHGRPAPQLRRRS